MHTQNGITPHHYTSGWTALYCILLLSVHFPGHTSDNRWRLQKYLYMDSHALLQDPRSYKYGRYLQHLQIPKQLYIPSTLPESPTFSCKYIHRPDKILSDVHSQLPEFFPDKSWHHGANQYFLYFLRLPSLTPSLLWFLWQTANSCLKIFFSFGPP